MWTLRRQLLLGTLSVVLIAVLAMMLVTHRLAQQAQRAEVETISRRSQALLSAALAPMLAERDLAGAQELFDELVTRDLYGYLQLENLEGKVLLQAGAVERLPPAPPANAAATAQDPVRGQFHFTTDIALEGHRLALLRFGLSSASTAALQRRLRGQLSLLAAIGLDVVGVLLWPLSRVLTRELVDLAEAADGLAAGRTEVCLPTGRTREMARLSQAFAGMQAALAQRFAELQESQQRLHLANDELELRVAARTAELAAARDTAERASRAKSEFLSRMSHELRTPLNAILGFAQVLRLRLQASAPDIDAQLGHVETAGWHLLALINDVLDLSRIETGDMPISAEAIELAPLVADCVRMSSTVLQAHEVRLSNQVDPAAALFVQADTTRLRQVLINLISNAAKYNRRGGQASLVVRSEADAVEIDVTDTGVGLSEAQLAHLFQPFNRLGAEQGQIEGTDIGLVVSKRLVELMGGRLTVRSEPGQGSCFTVRLRRSLKAQAAKAEAAAPAPPPGRQLRLLYIEDNPANVELLAHVLELRPGVELLTAADAETGLQLVQQAQPDLVVVDIALPGMDGYTLCRRLRALPEFSTRPIVALSANAMPGDTARGRAAGFTHYFTKPLDVAQFLQWLDRHTAAE